MYEKLRKHPRISLRTELWIGQDGIFTRTDEFLRDLSVGGAFVQSRQVYSVGTVINLRFKMPRSASLATCSAIVRICSMATALAFSSSTSPATTCGLCRAILMRR
ncbi:MAG: PilZ domain-containing protein [Chloracidobacterium sp.]|nr:PilZ domain-containing protein [Chloracidobacterium sp.]